MPWLCHIEFLSGPKAGHRQTFDLRVTPKVTVGSDALAQVQLSADDYPGVSRRHLAVTADSEDEAPLMSDTSLEGTFVHGSAVRSKPLRQETDIQLGKDGPLIRITPERQTIKPALAPAAPSFKAQHTVELSGVRQPHARRLAAAGAVLICVTAVMMVFQEVW